MKFVVASVFAMALLLNPAEAADCTPDQLEEILDLTTGEAGYLKCIEKSGSSVKKICACFEDFVDAYEAIDCDGEGKIDPATDPDFAEVTEQCAKGSTFLGVVSSCLSLDLIGLGFS
jgi:hypothetical protein